MTENNYSEKSLFDNPQEEKPKKEDSIKLIIKSLQTLNLTGSVPPELLNKNLWELPIPKKTKNLIIKTYKDNNGKDNIKSCFNKTKKLYNIDLPKLAEALYSLDDVYISILEKNEEGQIRATICLIQKKLTSLLKNNNDSLKVTKDIQWEKPLNELTKAFAEYILNTTSANPEEYFKKIKGTESLYATEFSKLLNSLESAND